MKKFFLSKSISVLQALSAFVILGVILAFGMKKNLTASNSTIDNKVIAADCDPHFNPIRNRVDYKFTRPLIAVNLETQSDKLNSIKAQLSDLINNRCKNGTLAQGSIYLKNLENGEWTAINENTGYHPGSLAKVPTLICYLKGSERDPSILDKKYKLTKLPPGMPHQNFEPENSVQANKYYTVRELLKYMIVYSDNAAAYLLNMNMNTALFQKVFTDFGLKKPELVDPDYMLTVKEYSMFLRVLYNATYLSADHSDFALDLLTKSPFHEGLTKTLPMQTVVAHKFGETNANNNLEMHESGIIYCDKHPYLVTMMTKGYDLKIQAEAISEASDLIYKFFCN
ncbi:MAG: serine hydrolase [Bacteroidota bacterium]